MFTWEDSELNSEQTSAVLEDESLLLVACPGSGKTRTLTYKIALELSKLKSRKQFIVAITYTNRAADEIKDRVELLGVDISQLWIGTIHSFCLEWILRPYSLYQEELKHGFTVLNSHDSEVIISELCKPYSKLKITHWDVNYYAHPDGFKLGCQDITKTEAIKEIIKDFHNIILAQNQIDFELLLLFSYQLLQSKPIISATLSKLFPYILIDEYQDTKEVQYHIIGQILNAGGGETKAFIVGDPNQSIFETMGGFPMDKVDIEALIGFSLNDSYTLQNNYRSSSRITEYFDYYKTIDNTIIPAGKHRDFESTITYNYSVSKDEFEEEIAGLISESIETHGILPSEICVAAPQWIPLAALTRNLMVKLPDYNFDGPGMAPFARDIDNFWYKVSKIVLTEPSPHLYVRRLRWAKEVILELANAGVDVQHITPKIWLKFCNSVEIAETDGLTYLEEFFSCICTHFDIDLNAHPQLKEHSDSFFKSSNSRIELITKAGSSFAGHIDNFRKVFKQRDGIKISTIHGIKGAEFDIIIGFGLLNKMVPYFSDQNGAVNSKRMLYVLCSRARKHLHLISETRRRVGYYDPNGLQPTPCLESYSYDYDER